MKSFLQRTCLLCLVSASLILFGCAGDQVEEGVEGAEVDPSMTDTATMDNMGENTARAILMDPTGTNIGTITFIEETGQGVRIEGTVSNLDDGSHGFHVHANGECDPNAAEGPFTSAGGHYDPMNTNNHAGPDTPAEERHMGDLGNIQASNGQVVIDETFDFLTLSGSNGIVGKAIMIHANQDDLETDPSGDAGSRVACGVIEMAEGTGMGTDTTGMGETEM